MSPVSTASSGVIYHALKACGIVEAVGPSGYVTDLSLLENRFQFQRYLRS